MFRALSNQRLALSALAMRVRIISAKKPKPAEVGAEAEVTLECAVEERMNIICSLETNGNGEGCGSSL